MTPWMCASSCGIEDGRLLVQRAPPLHREVDDRDVDERDERGDRVALRRCRSGRRSGCVAARGSRGRGRRGRPCVTSRASHAHQMPQTGRPHSEPEHERERGEQHPELGGRAGEAVPDHRAGPGPEEQGGRERGDPEREVGEPRRGDVEVHEPLRFLLGRVLGRTPEAEQPEHRQRDERGPPEDAARASGRADDPGSSCLLPQWSEGQHADRGVEHCEDAQQRDPRPRVSRCPFETILEGPGRPEHDRCEHRKQKQRQQRLAEPEPGSEHAVEGTGGSQTDGRGQRRSGSGSRCRGR